MQTGELQKDTHVKQIRAMDSFKKFAKLFQFLKFSSLVRYQITISYMIYISWKYFYRFSGGGGDPTAPPFRLFHSFPVANSTVNPPNITDINTISTYPNLT